MDKKTQEAKLDIRDLPALPELNEVTIVGRLANAPKLFGQGDKERAQFILAVPRPKRGEARYYDHLAVVAWRAIAQQCRDLAKGDGLRVEGRIKTWQDEGKRFHCEIEADLVAVIDRVGESQQPELAGV